MCRAIFVHAAFSESRFRHPGVAACVLLAAASFPGFAGEPGRPARPDKAAYHLFNPTPRDRMRDLAADRPDTTESPITVDAGHFQIESSFFDYGRQKRSGTREEIFTYGAVNVKMGLLNNLDLQVVFDSYVQAVTTDLATDAREVAAGPGDVQVRLKLNAWGNDGGRTALAIFPFVKIPAGSEVSNKRVEGGLIVPFSVEINDRFSLGLMAEADFVRIEGRDGFELEFVHTAVLGAAITGKLGAFVEYVGVAGSFDFDYQASLSGGITYGLSKDVQLDAGLRAGLNEAAEDFGVFAGITVRF